MNSTIRPLAITLAALALLIATAATAEAKSDISVSVVPVATQIDVTATGSDDAGGFQRLCIDRQIGDAHWHKLACAPISFAAGGTVHVYIPLNAPGPEHFRARLFRLGSPTGGAPVLDRASPTVTIITGNQLSITVTSANPM